MSKKVAQSGAVSMITVIMLSIFLSLITTGFVRLMVSYQRESTNSDLSNRAYYAAQSGFEDTQRLINSEAIKIDKTYCAPFDPAPPQSTIDNVSVASTDSGVDASYTCQLVKLKPESLTVGGNSGGVKANQAVVFPLNPDSSATSPAPFKTQISWVNSSSNESRDTVYKTLPTTEFWRNHNSNGTQIYPSMMRANLVWVNKTDLSTIKSQAFYFNPTVCKYVSSDCDNPGVNLNGIGGLPAEPTVNAQCDTSGNCQANLGIWDTNSSGNAKLFDTYQVFLVVRPIYQNADSISVSLTDKDGTALSFNSGQASIDITGKAGNVYRRIKQTVPYGKFQVKILPDASDFALVSGDGICKQISLSSSPDYYTNSCP